MPDKKSALQYGKCGIKEGVAHDCDAGGVYFCNNATRFVKCEEQMKERYQT